MGNVQVKGGDAESPESTPFIPGGVFSGGGEEPSDPNINFNFPLHLAACRGDLEKVKEHLNNGNSDKDSSSSVTRGVDDFGRSPLHCATHPASSHNLKVIELLLQLDKDDDPSSSSAGKPLLLLANLQDASGKTALHHAAASEKPAVVSRLLKSGGADPNLKDGEGSTPLHILAENSSDSALECAQLILDSGSLSPSAGSETNANGQTPVHVATLCKAPKLLRLFVKTMGFDAISADNTNPKYTPLMVACSKEDGNSKENVECVRILLEAYTPEQVNATDEYGRTALHMAALFDWFKLSKLLVSSPKTDLFIQDTWKDTVFHYAIWGSSLSSVKSLCECEQMSRKKFVEMVFRSNKPIEAALHCQQTKIVECLLAAHPNKEQWMSDEELMNLIYSKTPTALLPRMNQSLTYAVGGGHDLVDVDFRIIIGAKDPVERAVPETKYLYQIKDSSDEEQKLILTHPLVQIFLERKWKRIRPLTWIHILLQLSWVVCYTLMVYEMYAPNCHHTDEGEANQKETEEEGGGGGGREAEEGKGNGHMRILHSLGFLQWEEDCRVNQIAVQATAVILYLLTTLVLVKESFQILMKPKLYFWDVVNFVQLGLLVIAVVNSVPVWTVVSSASEAAPWQINLAAIGIFVSWVMLLSELDNFPKCALYSAILKRVLWNCLKTLLFYCPLLIGFAMCLRLLTPGKGQHKYLLFSLVKVVAMMTGELDFEDAFYGDDSTSGPSLAYNDILGQVMFLLLLLVTTIVLLNLLTGLAVSDVGRLLEEADVNRLFMQLERMDMLDSLVLLAREKLIFWFGFWENLLYRWNVTAVRDSNNKYIFSAGERLDIKDFPKDLQARMRKVIGGVEDGGGVNS